MPLSSRVCERKFLFQLIIINYVGPVKEVLWQPLIFDWLG